MSTQTPNDNHGPNHVPDDQLDVGVDTPTNLRVNAREAEDEVILKKLLGVNANNSALSIAAFVSQKIFDVVSGTRHHLDQAHFRDQLNEKIQSALDRAHPHNKARKMEAMWNRPQHGGESAYNEKVKIIVDAIRELLPSEMLQNFVRTTDGLEIDGQPAMVDLSHAFWKDKMSMTEEQIAAAVEGHHPEDVGVSGASIPTTSSMMALTKVASEKIAKFVLRHQVLNALSEGSENTMGMAFAAQLVKDHANLANVIKGKSKKETEDKLAIADRNVILFDILSDLEKGEKDLGEKSIEDLNKIIQDIDDAPKAVDFGKNDITIDGQTASPDGRNDTENKQSLRKQLRELRKGYADKRNALMKIGAKMADVIDVLATYKTPLKGSSFELVQRNFNTVVPANLNLRSHIKNFKEKYEFEGKTKEELEKQVKDLKAQKEHSGDLKGDAAQFAIVKEYLMKYKNMNATDAKKTAGYILARSLLDNDMMHSVEELAQEIAGPAVDPTDQLFTWFGNMQHLSFNAEGRANQIVGHIAEACHIPTRRAFRRTDFRLTNQPTNFTVKWESATYADLVSAYYSIKKLKDGEGPKGISLHRPTKFVQESIKEISRVLLAKHAAKLVQDFGPAIADKVGTEKAAELKAAPLKEEHLKVLAELLEGTPPEKYKHRIDHAIERANGRTDWWRRQVFAPALGKTYSMAKTLYYTAPKAAAQTVSRHTVSIVKNVAAKKKGIAIAAITGSLIIPGIGTLIGAGLGAAFADKDGGGGGDDHGHGH